MYELGPSGGIEGGGTGGGGRLGGGAVPGGPGGGGRPEGGGGGMRGGRGGMPRGGGGGGAGGGADWLALLGGRSLLFCACDVGGCACCGGGGRFGGIDDALGSFLNANCKKNCKEKKSILIQYKPRYLIVIVK